MAKINIHVLQPIKAEFIQLSDLDLEAIVGGLSIIGDFCECGVDFVPGEIFKLPNAGEDVRLKPVFIPCQPKPPVSLRY
jgi:hypothetical protein